MPLIEATPDHLDRWQSELWARQLDVGSIAGYTSHVAGFYGWAVEAGHLEIDPSTRLPRPKVPERKPRPIPDDDLATALLCAAEPVRTWLVLAAFMGLRAMEIAWMRRDHIVQIGKRLYLDGVGKGNREFRLPMPPEVVEALTPYLAGQPGPLWRTGPGGHPIRPRDVTSQTTAFFRAIGMPYTIHRARHSFGTNLYAQTRNLLLVKKLMRHKSAAMTQLYVELATLEEEKAMDKLARKLRRKPARGRAS